MTTRGKEAPARPTFSQDSGKAGTNQDGNAAHTHEDNTVVIELAHLIAEIGNGRVRR